jgi:hypothetical protein
MLLTIKFWADHKTVYPVPITKEDHHRRPEAAAHDRIDFRQTLAFELPDDLAPAFFRLRKATSDLSLAGK